MAYSYFYNIYIDFVDCKYFCEQQEYTLDSSMEIGRQMCELRLKEEWTTLSSPYSI